MRALAVLALAALVLAGCSDPPKSTKEPDPFADTPAAAAGKGLIRGLVLDPALTPVDGAKVALAGGAETSTDANGAFVFLDLEPGSYFFTASKAGWTSVQQSAEVVAGVQEPAIVKILIERVPGTEPRAVTLSQEGYISCSWGTPANYGSCATIEEESPEIYFDIEGTPRWIQTEVRWVSTQPSGEWLYLVQGLCSCDGGVPDVGEARFDELADAVSPHVAWADPDFLQEWDVGSADAKQLVVSVSASGPQPDLTFGTGVALNQQFEVYATFFYNFDPDPSWSFGANGPYPVPGS